MDRRGLVSAGGLLVLLLAAAPDLHAQPQTPPPQAACADAARLDALLAQSAQAFTAREPDRGLRLLDEVFDQATRLGCGVQHAEALLRLGIADSYQQKHADAGRKFSGAAEEFRRLGVSDREAEALLQLGATLVADARHGEAIAPLERARALARTRKDAQLELRVLDHLAYAMDEGPEKDRFRADALAFVRATPGGRRVECPLLQEWGDKLFNQDRYSEAFPIILDSVACFEQAGTPSQIGRAYTSLGRVYRAHGRLAEALEQYARAVAIQQEDTRDPLGAIQSLNAIGVTLGFMGREVEGLERLNEALGIARRRGSERTVDFLLGNVASFHLDQGRYAEAAAALEESLGKPALAYETLRLAELSRAYVGLKRGPQALEVAERAVKSARSDSEQVTALAARVHALIALRRFDEASRDLGSALQAVEALRDNTVADDFLKRGFSQRYQGLFSSAISLLEDQGRSREAIETAERARARALLDLLAARGRPGAAADAAPASFGDITAAAARMRSTVIAYWVSPAETFVWAVKPDGSIASARVPVTATALAKMIHTATGGGSSSQAQLAALLLRRRSDARPWRALYRTLLEPVRRSLPAAGGRLTIVAHGPLFGVPFAALVDPAGRYLVESYELHYVPAIGTLAASPPRSPRGASALLVGDPGPEAARDRLMPLPALPWADREVSAIDRLLPSRAVVLRGRQATETNVRRQLEGRTLLHFATHGIVQNEEHLASYLALRPADDHPGAGDADGRLTANETYGLRLDADLIVLSGCRTAMGPIMGDGVIGFTRAFLAAGAASVVATMWDVADQTSFEVMRSFYGAWVGGADKSRALRRAQLSVIRQLRAGTIRVNGIALPESPRFWAGYVLVGQP